MTALLCPVCDSASGGGHAVSDATVFICPRCGGYRMSGTILALLRSGAVSKPDPESFRHIVARKRGDSAEHPLITSYDLSA